MYIVMNTFWSVLALRIILQIRGNWFKFRNCVIIAICLTIAQQSNSRLRYCGVHRSFPLDTPLCVFSFYHQIVANVWCVHTHVHCTLIIIALKHMLANDATVCTSIAKVKAIRSTHDNLRVRFSFRTHTHAGL